VCLIDGLTAVSCQLK